ncbi:MAG TPA: PilZ domain-containing protein [Syntrophales bacterium]|nr:PilZ domain-containing protein [Syntrophales bacterium]
MENLEDKREYARVTAYLPFEVRLVPTAEREFRRSRISGVAVLSDFAKPPEPEDKLLAQWLNMLNAKLDSIISTLSVEREGFCSLTYQMLNISGNGMGFKTKEKYNKGDFLEIKILLYMYPHVALYLYGDVVKSEQEGDNFDTAVKFMEMTDDIRDEIIKFVFRRQREILSAKRG